MTQENAEATDSSRDATQPARRGTGRALLLGSLAVVVVVAGGLILLLSQTQVSGVSGFREADGRALFRALDDDVARARAVAIESDEGTITLERAEEGARWRLAEADGYPARQGAVEDLLRRLASLRAAYVSEGESPPYAEYGLSAPDSSSEAATVVSVRDGAGEPIARAAFGHAFAVPGLPEDRGVFVRIPDDPRVWLADREASVPARQSAWLENGIMDVPGQSVQRVALSGAGADRIVIGRNDEGALALEQGLPEGMELKGPWVLDMLSGLFEQVEFEAVRAADTIPAEAEEVRAAALETSEGVVYAVRLMSPGGDPAARRAPADVREIWAIFSAEPADGADAAAERQAERFAARHEGWAYRLPVHIIDNLSVGPQDIARQGALQ